MRVVGGLGIVVGSTLLVLPVAEPQAQWTVTVGDAAPYTTTVHSDKTTPAIQVLVRSLSQGSPRKDAAIRVGGGLAAIAFGFVDLLKARDTSPWNTA